MRKTLLLALLLLGMSAQAGFFTDRNSRALCTGDAGLELQHKFLYYFTGNELSIISNDAGESALRVADSAIVFIYIATGQTLTLKGGDGKARIGGGAGIEVPQSSTLYVMGGGKLITTGGDVGLGSRGADGLEGEFVIGDLFDIDEYYGGEGGAGGNGGGGAGAGIGGTGGTGGQGAAPAYGPRMEMSDDNDGSDGTKANQGGKSESGANCGKVYLVGSLVIDAKSGATNTKDGETAVGSLSKRKRGGTFENDYIVGGGGAGGNGNNGLQAAMIGGGGAGAAGAGSGSSGGVTNAYTLDAGSLIKRAAQTITKVVINTIIKAITKNPTGDIIIVDLPLIGQYKGTVGGLVSKVLYKFINIDLYPLQINGGGGEGSFNPQCKAMQRNGLSFYTPELEYKNLFGTKIVRHCPPGGLMGEFGQLGTAEDIRKTSYVQVSQTMGLLTAPYPKELVEALTFTMSFDSTEIDITKPHATFKNMVYSDTLPSKVPVPVAKDGDKVFMGYSDELGQYWYNKQGQAMPTATDSTGKELKIYVHPGDVTLKPRWQTYNYVVVCHWQQVPSVTFQNGEEEYNLVEYELVPYLGKGWYKAAAKQYANFTAVNPLDSVNVQDSLVVLNFRYDRKTFNLAWDLPQNITVLSTNYTQEGNIRFGSKIRAPRYAQDNASGGFYELVNWTSNGQAIQTDTMPAATTSFKPELRKIYAAISYQNDDLYGTVKKADTWLGTNIQFSVQPNEGWELDTCYAIYFGNSVLPTWSKIDQSGNNLVLYGTPEYDSIAVRINYRGVVDTLFYTEKGIRQGSMTLYVNGDSITNDGKLDMKHPIRHGDLVGISPQPSTIGNQHVVNIKVQTKSGKVIPTTVVESYDAYNHYTRMYQFNMPNENVNVVAEYAVLASHQVNLRVRGTEPARVFSNRGELLDSTFIFGEGYLVEAGELIWIEALVDTTKVLDSIQVSYQEGEQAFTFETMERILFVKKAHPITPEDTTLVPVAYVRYSYRVPVISNELLIEFKYHGANFKFESEMRSGIDPLEEEKRTKRGIYNMMGLYMGEDVEVLPKGAYIQNGQKIIR